MDHVFPEEAVAKAQADIPSVEMASTTATDNGEVTAEAAVVEAAVVEAA